MRHTVLRYLQYLALFIAIDLFGSVLPEAARNGVAYLLILYGLLMAMYVWLERTWALRAQSLFWCVGLITLASDVAVRGERLNRLADFLVGAVGQLMF